MKIKRIVVPVDFSVSSTKALEFAADLAKPVDAELIVVFAVEPVLYVLPAYGGVPSGPTQQVAIDQRRAAERDLARIERRLSRRGIRVRTAIQTGMPPRVIVESAKRTKANLIVMATHGRTGVSRLIMGSVAERVVRSAACPVLTLHGGAAPATAKRALRRTAQTSTARARNTVRRPGGRR